jgi:hypothetical protein
VSECDVTLELVRGWEKAYAEIKLSRTVMSIKARGQIVYQIVAPFVTNSVCGTGSKLSEKCGILRGKEREKTFGSVTLFLIDQVADSK